METQIFGESALMAKGRDGNEVTSEVLYHSLNLICLLAGGLNSWNNTWDL